MVFVAIMALTSKTLASAFPVYGMATGSILVFLGVFSYVAFRDIFEGRASKLPKLVAAASTPSYSAASRAAC